MKQLLKFSPGNAKLVNIPSFNLPASYACPFALECRSQSDKVTGKITDGKDLKFRCFSATQENVFPQTRAQRHHNFDLIRKLKTAEEMANLICESLPKEKYNIIRIHVSGDFFNQTYFDAWMLVASRNPDRVFYAYTKSLTYWVNRIGFLPPNLSLTASWGGKNDNLITNYNLKSVVVVGSYEQAEELGLEIDHDDSHAFDSSKGSFALLIHGTQPVGSEMGKAKARLAKEGFTGYSRPNGYGKWTKNKKQIAA